MSHSKGRGPHKRKENVKIADEFKDGCPSHRQKDLDQLVKQCKGDRDKILTQITAWWEETPPVEEVWNDVGRKSKQRTNNANGHAGGGGGERSYNTGGGGGRHSREMGHRGGRSSGYNTNRSGGGRGGHGRGMAGGRGAGHDRRDRRDRGEDKGGRHRDRRDNGPSNGSGKNIQSDGDKPKAKEEVIRGVPAPVKNQPPLQGAWGQRAAPATTVQEPSTSAAPEPTEPVAPAPSSEPETASSSVPPPPVASVEIEDIVEHAIVVDDEPDSTPVVTELEPTPTEPVAPPSPTPVPAPPTGNVWATRGSAHLIQAEKPKPPPQKMPTEPQQQPPPPQTELPLVVVEEPLPVTEVPITETIIPETTSAIEELIADDPSDTINDGLPASVNGANINAAGWQPEVPVQPSPVGPVSVASEPSINDVPIVLGMEDTAAPVPPPPVEESIVDVEHVVVAPVTVEPLKQTTNVLNMGHWETGEGEEAQNMDFGFGSYGAGDDGNSVDETTTISSTTNNVTAAAAQSTTSALVPPPPSSEPAVTAASSTISPARPPPGLGLGMPPMPDKIVSVHELENKLENATLASKKEEPKDTPNETSLPDKLPDKPVTNNLTSSTQTSAAPAANQPNNEAFMMPPGVMPQGGYGMGMYNYNQQNAVTGFMGVPTPAGPVLSGGVVPQQPKQQNGTAQQSTGLPQSGGGGLYNGAAPASTPAGPETNTANSNETNTPNPTANGGMPPGMMPYSPNPAVFYGQHQPYQMAGQPHGVGYGYGYGQFGGVQNAGFYQQQVMGQGAGYGQPYEEQPQQQHHNHNTNNHQGGGGGYNKNGGGGYRGRNNHHNNNNNNNHNQQYQNQYNPQGHGGYGGQQQPYNMGYNDHFNQQRGGYGPGNMADPYMQNSAYQSGFSNQDDDQQLGKGKSKGNNRGNNNFGSNPNMNQYQQGPQSGSQSQPQHFGSLQGNAGGADNGNNGGLSYQSWGNGGL